MCTNSQTREGTKKDSDGKKYQNKFVTLGFEILEQENVPVSEHVP